MLAVLQKSNTELITRVSERVQGLNGERTRWAAGRRLGQAGGRVGMDEERRCLGGNLR